MNTAFYHEPTSKMVEIPIKLIEDKALSSRAKFIYILILSMKDKEPSIGKLPVLSGLNYSTVCKYLKELEATGWIVRKPVRDERGRIAGVEYIVNYEKA
jgi:predicted transcriptional regulator